MDTGNGSVSSEHRKPHNSVSKSADPLSVSPSQTSPKSPRSPRMHVKDNKQSPKHDKQPHSPKDGHSKKGKVFKNNS